MLAKVCSVFTGYSKGDFEGEKGEKIKWCNAAFSVPGTADQFILKVNLDEVNPDLLVAYKANYLMVDFRYDKKFNNWKGYIVQVFSTRDEMEEAPLDEIPAYLLPDYDGGASAVKAAVIANAAKKEA
ncbi:hypothetical protein [uncultured Adlercreutzia sp.]|uniref:hypothetical protein n=1 Tax=uncultured Adlercreutzia sp. TaxID=875803 RepID=UPI0026F3BDA3|nr:hypothetical protein [uncultured Adlercreutzia sp.]